MDVTEKKLECPFTWEIDHVNLPKKYESWSQGTSKYHDDSEDEEEEEEKLEDNKNSSVDHPIKRLIRILLAVFVQVKLGKLVGAKAALDAASDILKCMNDYGPKMRREHISRLVVTHIIESTWYYYYKAIAQESEASKTLNGLANLDQARHKYEAGVYTLSDNGDLEATLNGCKAIAWSASYKTGYEKAIFYAQQSLQGGGSSCALWHFTLGKNLRRQRRGNHFNKEISFDEEKHIAKAYELEPESILIAVFAAQMYREKGLYRVADKIYQQLYNAKVEDVKIRLRIALHFIHNKNFKCAEECLNYVEAISPNRKMFLHYKGIFFERQNNYKEAETYLKLAAEKGNYIADLQLGELMAKRNKSYNIIDHLKNIIEKHPNKPSLVQQVSLHIAMNYYLNKKNLMEALNYFLKAINIDPQSKQIKNYSNKAVNRYNINIYNFLCEKVLPEFNERYRVIPENMTAVIKDIENLCLQYKNC